MDKNWPLLVIDNQGKRRRINLDPGEMLLYESARMPHGRQIPFEGEFYDNLFVHFYIRDRAKKQYFQKVLNFIQHHHTYTY